MKKIGIATLLTFLVAINVLISSCNKDETSRIVGFEVSGSSFDGIYKFDETFTNGTKYVNQDDATEFLKTFTSNDTEMWGLFKSNTIYYKIPKSGFYPPESGWTCGLGNDKPNFRCTPVYE